MNKCSTTSKKAPKGQGRNAIAVSPITLRNRRGNGSVDDESFLAFIYELDAREEWTNQAVLTKDFNVRETVAGAWISFETANNDETFDIETLRECYAIGGVDLSATLIRRTYIKSYTPWHAVFSASNSTCSLGYLCDFPGVHTRFTPIYLILLA